MNRDLIYYLLLINLVSGIIFFTDKQKAKNKKRRISEKTLHLFEFAGGVFANIFLMYIIRHKNKKTKYFIITYIALILWIFAIFSIYTDIIFK